MIKTKQYVSDSPMLLSEWDYKKNSELGFFPETTALHSTKKVWWICKNNHSFDARVGNRANGRKCRYCSGKVAIPGEIDLATLYPNVVLDWDYDNNEVKPEEILPKTNRPIHWKCHKCGYQWVTSPNARTSRNHGCSKCASRYHTSFPEQAIYYYISQCYPDAINSYKEIFVDGNSELDIYIPSIKTAIEYDGEAYHKKRKKDSDYQKYELCRMMNIRLIRVCEKADESDREKCDILINSEYSTERKYEFNRTLEKLSQYVKLPTGFDVERDKNDIWSKFLVTFDDKSLEHVNHDLAKEWNYERNAPLKPNMFLATSGEKVWWRCKKGHEWQEYIYIRNKGVGCPGCANQMLIKGYNDLATTNPELVEEWDYEQNTGISPDSIMAGSRVDVHWICKKCGYKWIAKAYHRKAGSGCYLCCGRDIATVAPDLIEEWNYEKNGTVLPTQISRGYDKDLWWRCSVCGHEWQAKVYNRIKGSACPKCAVSIAKEKSYKTRLHRNGTFKQWCVQNGEIGERLLKEWNDLSKPEEYTPKSKSYVQWKCIYCGYERPGRIQNRVIHYKCQLCGK